MWLTAYLAAEAEAQGQEAEEVLAPSDHAGEAPAQSSHIDPQGGCLGERVWEGGPAAPGAELRRGWGMWGKARALPRGVPDPPRRRSSPSVLPPLAGGAPPKPRGATPKCLHLPGSPCGRRLHSPGLPPRLPLSSPRRDSLWPARFRGRMGGGRRHPATSEVREPRRKGGSDQGRGGARHQASTCGEGAAAVRAWAAVEAALCSKLQ